MAKIVPYRFYRTPTGAGVSIYSAYVPEGSELITEGFTIQWPDGTSGCGRKPFATEAEAQAFIDRNPRFTGMNQG